jgi:hypothetical protein
MGRRRVVQISRTGTHMPVMLMLGLQVIEEQDHLPAPAEQAGCRRVPPPLQLQQAGWQGLQQ